MFSRSDIVQVLSRALKQEPAARGAWLGGSDAMGRADAMSDIDLVVIAGDEAVQGIFALLESVMERDLGGIELRFPIPQPSWHGHEQCFYQLRQAAPEHMVDLLVIKPTAPEHTRFLETERHGQATILFDHDALIKPAPFDRPAHDRKMRERLEGLKIRFQMFQPLVTKAIARKQPIDAVAFYHSWTLAPLVEVLRMLHCPDRYDYGLRYLQDDLTTEAYQAVERLTYHASLEALADHHREAVALFRTTVAQLDAAC